MDPLTVIVGVVTILGVVWVLLAGSRTIAQVMADVRRWWAERRDRRSGSGAWRQSADLKPALTSVVTEVVTLRADSLEAVAVEERIRRLEQSHQEAQRKLASLEQRYPESTRPPEITIRHTRMRSRANLLQEQLARLQGRAAGQFARTESLVNRQREVEMIRKAFLDSPDLKVLYFYGPGGVGKTRVLEEAGHLVETLHGRLGGDGHKRISDGLLRRLAPWRGQAVGTFVWCGIVDLYHTDLHDSLSVQQAIVAATDLGRDHFQNYRRLATEFQQARCEGIDSRQLETMRRCLAEAFVQDYNTLAARRRVVLAFDTLETIQHESPVVQEVCQIKPDPVAVEAWLLQHVRQLGNSVVLLASRPRDDLLDAFQQAYGRPGQFQSKRLTGFTWSETQGYVRLLARQRPEVEILSKEMLWSIYHATEGLPVRLALALDLMLDRGLEGSLPPSVKLDEVLGHNLFVGLERDEPLMFCLALARKGLDPELLHYLKPEWPVSECHRRLAALQNLAYVKTRPGAMALFLHDELYALFDLFGPEQSKVAPEYARISEYYQMRQEELARERGREPWQQATANWLFYRLRAEPHEGYQSYVRLAEEAVKGHDFGFDMQLRDEMLRFFDDPINQRIAEQRGVTRQVFDRDATLRWVRRYIEKGQYAMACQAVMNVRQSNDPLFSNTRPLFYGALGTYYGEATQYLGQELPEALKALNETVERLSEFEPTDELDRWWCARILGRALNNIGYIHRQRQRYSSAVASFHAAVAHYRRAGVKDELADTLNNLAFAYSVLGGFAEAEREVHEALNLRRELGRRYPLALSLNTLGVIQLGARRLEQAQKHCTDALRIFEQLNAARGQGLACIALGEVYRQMAGRCTEATEAIALLQQAETRLEQAIGIFDEQIDEPLRLVEAANELGCTYRDLSVRMEQDGQSHSAQEFYDSAQDWLQRSIVEAEGRWPVLVADSCEDMARLFFEHEQKGFSDLPEPVEGFWLMLGKIRLLRGHLAYVIGDLQPSLHQYVLALSYLDRYSPTIPAFRRAQSEVRQRLRHLPLHSKEQAWQSVCALAEVYCVSADSLAALLA
jgi:tetratricopeptide (TPR) repeat protein